MGIPSYFSYVIRNYPNVIKKYPALTQGNKNTLKIDHFLLDCNSIIYDAYHKLDVSSLTDSVNKNMFASRTENTETSHCKGICSEAMKLPNVGGVMGEVSPTARGFAAHTEGACSVVNTIISSVIAKIEEYISIIQPTKTIYIAFDGVAPLAKLEQQRSRRYKSNYLNNLKRNLFKIVEDDPWNAVHITPGTAFMQSLNQRIREHFSASASAKMTSPSSLKVIVSGSDEVGEGEHKIFQYIREQLASSNMKTDETIMIYGLDADLIMLCLTTLIALPQSGSQSIYLFRETPEFIKSIDSTLEPNANYYLDIQQLAQGIIEHIRTSNGGSQISSSGRAVPIDGDFYIRNSSRIIADYIFLCFLMGNDFLPHFPALNIRTGGIDKIIQMYQYLLSQPNEEEPFLISAVAHIQWKQFRIFIGELAKCEEEYIQEEYKLRNKWEHRHLPQETAEEKMKYVDNIPQFERDIEKYIQPMAAGWQQRYYDALTRQQQQQQDLEKICTNYLEGLEWTFYYYNQGCIDWRWCYQYHYPPLLQDLVQYIPTTSNRQFISANSHQPVSALVQLCYVLPQEHLNILPPRLHSILTKKYAKWYKTDCEFLWAFCRYFWESHVQMPHIPIEKIEEVVAKYLSKRKQN